MPPAKEGEPELRKFIAPIVYPKAQFPASGHFPPPRYPAILRWNRTEGLVLIEIMVASSGQIDSVQTILSSGNTYLDNYTANWVLTKWKFPPGEKRWYHCPFVYKFQ